MVKITKTARKVLTGLEQEEKPVSAEELAGKLEMSIRSVRYGLKRLVKDGIVKKYQSLEDMRTSYYVVAKMVQTTNTIGLVEA